LKEKKRLEDLGIDGKIILKCFLKGWNVRVWAGCICLRRAEGGMV